MKTKWLGSDIIHRKKNDEIILAIVYALTFKAAVNTGKQGIVSQAN
ncbi:hypothetical protein [Levilactobacillus yiduensis]|nr:hypothetical protein [Levilactobacillus yiduensis]